MFFWVVTVCRLVGRYQRSKETLKIKTVCFSETMASTEDSVTRQQCHATYFSYGSFSVEHGHRALRLRTMVMFVCGSNTLAYNACARWH